LSRPGLAGAEYRGVASRRVLLEAMDLSIDPIAELNVQG
jgi:hypothetical protein